MNQEEQEDEFTAYEIRESTEWASAKTFASQSDYYDSSNQTSIGTEGSSFRSSATFKQSNVRGYIQPFYFICNTIKTTNGNELSFKGKDFEEKFGRRVDDEDIPPIISYLEQETGIVSLDLSYNLVSDLGFVLLCEHVSRSGSLAALNLRNNELRDLGEAACGLLRGGSALKRLVLSGNDLSCQSAEHLKALLAGGSGLLVLELSGVGYHVHSATRIVDSLVGGHNLTLRALDLSRLVGMPRHGFPSPQLAEQVRRLLVGNEGLVELHLEKNELSYSEVETIAAGLERNKKLMALNLTANACGSIGLYKIADALPSSSLRVLLLKCNGIGDHGAIALSKALPRSNVVHLDISDNKIGDVGLANLLWTINKDPPLLSFYVFGNPFTHETLDIIHEQMVRGKMAPSCLDLVLYWGDDGRLRCSYDPSADQFRHEMFGLYRGGSRPKSRSGPSYPVYDVFHPHRALFSSGKACPLASETKAFVPIKENFIIK